MQPLMPWAKLHWDWMKKLWSPSCTRVTMGSTGRVDAHDSVVVETDEEIHRQVQGAAIQARADHTHVNLHMTDWMAAQWKDPVLKAVIDWISYCKVQNLKNLLGEDTNTEEGVAILWEWKKLMLYQGDLYHCHTLAGELGEVMWFVVHPHKSSSGCYEWMSPWCCTPGLVVNAVPHAGLVLVVWHGHTDVESDQQLQMMHPTWRHLCQSTNATHHCHHSFGATTDRPHKHWDNYRAALTTKCGECSGFLW